VPETGPGSPGAGILQSLRNLAATGVALLRTRLELLATEIEEERLRLLSLLFWAAGAFYFLAVGVLLLAVLVIVVFWESHRVAAVAVLAGLFLAIGAGMAAAARKSLAGRRKLLSASLDELEKDNEQLTRR